VPECEEILRKGPLSPALFRGRERYRTDLAPLPAAFIPDSLDPGRRPTPTPVDGTPARRPVKGRNAIAGAAAGALARAAAATCGDMILAASVPCREAVFRERRLALRMRPFSCPRLAGNLGVDALASGLPA